MVEEIKFRKSQLLSSYREAECQNFKKCKNTILRRPSVKNPICFSCREERKAKRYWIKSGASESVLNAATRVDYKETKTKP